MHIDSRPVNEPPDLIPEGMDATREGLASSSRSRASVRVAAGIFLSRITGLIRERVFAHYFGASSFADAWRAALRMPNVLQNLLGEGTLSASFIPIYSELLKEERHEEGARFAGARPMRDVGRDRAVAESHLNSANAASDTVNHSVDRRPNCDST